MSFTFRFPFFLHSFLLPSFFTNKTPQSCHCGAQFCYVCAAPWKSCPCPQFTEANIIPGGIADGDDEADDEDDNEDALDDDGFNIFQLELLRLAHGDDAEENAVGGAAREAGSGPAVGPDGIAEAEPDVEEIPRPPNPLAPARNNNFGWGGGGWGAHADGARGHPPQPLDPCRRHRYRFQRTTATCEICDFLMPQFCFECRRCRQRICNHCRGRTEVGEGRVDPASARVNPWDRVPNEMERAVEVERPVEIRGPVVEVQRPLDLETLVEPAPTPAPAPEPEGAVGAVEVESAPAHERPTEPERLALEAAPVPPPIPPAVHLPAPLPAQSQAPPPGLAPAQVPEPESAAFPPENERRFTLIPAVLFPVARPRSGGIGINTPAQDATGEDVREDVAEDAGEDAGEGTGEDASGQDAAGDAVIGEDSSEQDAVQNTAEDPEDTNDTE